MALSSAEAELIAIVRGASEGLGIKGLAADFNVVTGVSVHADATAALGICKRTGVGRIRHLDTRLLWIQDKARAGEVQLHKAIGAENPSDLLTKLLDAETAGRHAARLGSWKAQGRAAVSPDLEP